MDVEVGGSVGEWVVVWMWRWVVVWVSGWVYNSV